MWRNQRCTWVWTIFWRSWTSNVSAGDERFCFLKHKNTSSYNLTGINVNKLHHQKSGSCRNQVSAEIKSRISCRHQNMIQTRTKTENQETRRALSNRWEPGSEETDETRIKMSDSACFFLAVLSLKGRTKPLSLICQSLTWWTSVFTGD